MQPRIIVNKRDPTANERSHVRYILEAGSIDPVRDREYTRGETWGTYPGDPVTGKPIPPSQLPSYHFAPDR